jgi:hypothetical protein
VPEGVDSLEREPQVVLLPWEKGEPLPWSTLAPLVLVNLIPLYQVVFRGASVFAVVLLFTLENMVIGFFNVLKMRRAEGDAKAGQIAAFVFIYGAFTLGHLAFVFMLFGLDTLTDFNLDWPPGFFWGVSVVIAGMLDPFTAGEIKLWFPLLGLFVSHGLSYRINFIGRREFEQRTVESLVFRPFQRVFVLHVTVLLGGLAVTLTGTHVSALILLVLLKIGVDARAHLLERRWFAGRNR